MLAPFFAPILAALRWLATTAFTGLFAQAAGVAILSGFVVFLARAGVSVIVFTIIMAATTAMMSFALAQGIDAQVLSILQQTGMTVGINIMLSTLQAIIAIRVIKISLVKATAL